MRVPNEEGKFGKLDAESEALFKKSPGAHAAVVIVVGPPEVSGFSVSSTDMRITASLPALLRDVANNIEAQLRAVKNS